MKYTCQEQRQMPIQHNADPPPPAPRAAPTTTAGGLRVRRYASHYRRPPPAPPATRDKTCDSHMRGYPSEVRDQLSRWFQCVRRLHSGCRDCVSEGHGVAMGASHSAEDANAYASDPPASERRKANQKRRRYVL
ncbi:hypothetical protein JYU34_016939 [Plutella xylostella]|uniref:Uncharacterized protein n=1 Tax=Plutella xylostella TaxID=51655 RepID=A0ABQ7Q4U5_PLUXY|nr:hypothetical protein JYU34_016939 [Plutella xylostella]